MSTPSLGRYGVSTPSPSLSIPEKCSSLPHFSPDTVTPSQLSGLIHHSTSSPKGESGVGTSSAPSSVMVRDARPAEPELNMKVPDEASSVTKKRLAEHSTSGTTTEVSEHPHVANDEPVTSACSGTEVLEPVFLPQCEHSCITGDRGQASSESGDSVLPVNPITSDHAFDVGKPEEYIEPIKGILFDEMADYLKEIDDFDREYEFSKEQKSVDEISLCDTESVTPPDLENPTEAELSSSTFDMTKRMMLLEQVKVLAGDIIRARARGIYSSDNLNGGFNQFYELIFESIKASKLNKEVSPVFYLQKKIISLLNSTLGCLDGESHKSMKAVIEQLEKCSSPGEVSEYLKNSHVDYLTYYHVCRDIVLKAMFDLGADFDGANLDCMISLLSICFLEICKIEIKSSEIELYRNLYFELHTALSPASPEWRRSFANVLAGCFTRSGITLLYLTDIFFTILHSIGEGEISNEYQFASQFRIFLVLYSIFTVIPPSLKNSYSIYRAGKNNPETPKKDTVFSIATNFGKDLTALGGSVFSLLGVSPATRLCQLLNLGLSTIFARDLIHRFLEAYEVDMRPMDWKGKAKIYAPAILIGGTCYFLPLCIPETSKKYWGYSGGDQNFIPHTLRSLVNNLFTPLSGGDEVIRLLLIASLSASSSLTAHTFLDIKRCDNSIVREKLNTYLKALAIRFGCTVATVVIAVPDAYPRRVGSDGASGYTKGSWVSIETTESASRIPTEPIESTTAGVVNSTSIFTVNGSDAFATANVDSTAGLSNMSGSVTEPIHRTTAGVPLSLTRGATESSVYSDASGSNASASESVEYVTILPILGSFSDLWKSLYWEDNVRELGGDIKRTSNANQCQKKEKEFSSQMQTLPWENYTVGGFLGLVDQGLEGIGYYKEVNTRFGIKIPKKVQQLGNVLTHTSHTNTRRLAYLGGGGNKKQLSPAHQYKIKRFDVVSYDDATQGKPENTGLQPGLGAVAKKVKAVSAAEDSRISESIEMTPFGVNDETTPFLPKREKNPGTQRALHVAIDMSAAMDSQSAETKQATLTQAKVDHQEVSTSGSVSSRDVAVVKSWPSTPSISGGVFQDPDTRSHL
ncbi:hypothetical protein [Endozoicomonas elysicola]|uniref:Uncharacterized protein n=1 Tax=Endozoicomonas elysicola TaxID=305900 RepID=A0A081KF12_9GAMM|nr:hypothetical protein [Endozoicomonas elysicola]KEI72738.1 hypothetical protein GV64_20185 [Endozoicomonas elysicola]